MQPRFFLFLFAFGFLLTACQPTQKGTEILWDEWGVPHIYSDNNEDLFYAHGWAQMHNHANLILQLYGTSRGRAAEYFGAANLPSDMMVHSLMLPEKAREWWDAQNEEMKTNFSAFVRGLNDYAEAHPEAIADDKKAILPVTETDVTGHFLFVVGTRFVGGNDLGLVANYEELGSNTYAVDDSRSANGHAMLVQNPHLPWGGEFTWMEAHLSGPNGNMYGATLVGFPTLGIAFNEHLGWSHTNNTIDNADTYELTLQDGGYVLDGEVKQFEVRKKTIKVKGEDGSLQDRELTLLSSDHGPVVKMGQNNALAVRLAGLDNYEAPLEWWKMASSTNLEEFKTAVQMMQIPFFNIMYADVAGNIFYMFNGSVPERTEGDWGFWNNLVPGDRSELIWNSYHPYEDMPKVENPETGWLQNANDPPWTSTIPLALDADEYPPYMAPRRMSFRPQRSARMLYEDENITFDELLSYKLSTRMELADRVLDDLFAAIGDAASDLAKEAKGVLENWDRQANPDSKGALLFYAWANRMNFNNPAAFATPWTVEDPLNTPDGLADPAQAVAALEGAAEQIQQAFGSLDAPWGAGYRIKRGSYDLPGNGADGSVGIFRVAWPGNFRDGKYYIGGGDSWVAVIEFGDEVKAKVLLSYGNSSQPGSPHNGDQLQLFSDLEMRDAYLYRKDVEAHATTTEKLEEGKFVAN